MNKSATQSASYQDLLDLPDTVVGEIIAGDLIAHPRQAPKHALALSALGSVVFNHFDRSSSDGPGGWWILHKPECHLGDDVLVPDIARWRNRIKASAEPWRRIQSTAN